VSGYIVQRTVRQAQVQSGAAGSQSQTMSWTDPRAPGRGAGASHAWIEAYTPTHGWRGFDPTNDLVASEFHIKMAIGRDYADVPPTRGTFRGVASERLTVDVRTESLD
jgi:transglutaminase-like putative cysteine protease